MFTLQERAIIEIERLGFTQDVLFNLFFDLLESSMGDKFQHNNLYISKWLGVLNGRLIGQSLFKEGKQDIKMINNILSDTDLFSNPGELRDFMFKKSDGSFNFDQEQKEWLDLYLTKILTYVGSNQDIIDARDKLASIIGGLTDPLGVSRDNEYFIDTEITFAKRVLESAEHLMGHGTIRLILLGMANVDNAKNFRVLSRFDSKIMFKIMRHTGFTSPRLTRNVPQFGDGPLSAPTTDPHRRDQIYFGALLLDSHISFRLDPTTWSERKDSHIFPFGPIPLSGITLEASSNRDLSFEIASYLATIFSNNYGKRLQVIDGVNMKIDNTNLFLEKQNNLINKFLVLIENDVMSKRITEAKKLLMITQLSNYVRSALSIFLDRSSSFRGVFEAFIDSGDTFTEIEFPFLDLSNGKYNYKLPIYYKDFAGVDIALWAYSGGYTGIPGGLSQAKFNKIKNENIGNVVEQLKKEILLVGGHVKIYPLYATNTGFKANANANGFPVHSPRATPPTPFMIDLRNPSSPDYQNSEYILRHIVFLLSGSPVGFAVKDINSEFGDNHAYFVFTRDGYLKSNQILTSAGNGRPYYLEFYDEFNDPDNPGNLISFYANLDVHNQDWKDAWKFSAGMTHGSHSEFTTYYLYWLRDSMDDMAVYLRGVVRHPTN